MSTKHSLLENPEEKADKDKQLEEIVKNLKQPIIEIGGPTPGGYDFLVSGSMSLPFKPIVTNVTETVVHNPFGENPTEYTVDEVADAKSLPYEDQSTGTLIACNIPQTTADIFQQFDTEEERLEYLSQSKAAALGEYDNYTANTKLASNLRLMFIREAARVLFVGGHLIIQGATEGDKQAAKMHRLEVVYEDPSTNTSILRNEQLDS